MTEGLKPTHDADRQSASGGSESPPLLVARDALAAAERGLEIFASAATELEQVSQQVAEATAAVAVAEASILALRDRAAAMILLHESEASGGG